MRYALILLVTWTATAGLASADAMNHCEITVSGDATATIKADAPRETQGKLGASTDHWLSDAQLRTALQMMQSIDSKASAEDKKKKIDEAMTKDPRFMVLLLNCLTDDGGVTFTAASKTKYADIPMKPASYALVSMDHPKPGELTVFLHITSGGKRQSYSVREPGKLTLTQFNRKGIAGTFTFKAEQRGTAAKKVSVTGSFNYGCVGDACQK
jgi:hypothetical protein